MEFHLYSCPKISTGDMTMIILLMGITGSGKSKIGKLLADSLHWEFSDADTFHPPANIEKMSQGIPLNDVDRAPWLQAIQHAINRWLQEEQNVVLACSALKATYRQILCCNHSQIRLVYLKGSFELLESRLTQRQDHFMEINLLQSQFDILEEPEDGIQVDIAQPPEVIVEQIRLSLKL